MTVRRLRFSRFTVLGAIEAMLRCLFTTPIRCALWLLRKSAMATARGVGYLVSVCMAALLAVTLGAFGGLYLNGPGFTLHVPSANASYNGLPSRKPGKELPEWYRR